MIPAQALGPLAVVGCLLTGATSMADTTSEATYGDPFDSCAAVGTADARGPHYIGPAMPDVLARKLKEASGAAADAPLAPFQDGPKICRLSV
jgi:cytochrome c2